MFDKFYHHTRLEKGMWRGWFSYNHDDGWRSRWEFIFNVVWGKGHLLGFRLHLGNTGSETPVDFSFGFYWLAFYFSFDFPRLGEFCEWIGRGHKREISLRIFSGKLWWNLWYDDDNGYHPYHNCDKHRRPKLWPWSRGRNTYRSWMCLREGGLELNPLDAIWGTPRYNYVTKEEDVLLVEVGEFPNDEYMLTTKLQEAWRGREHGPRWVRRKKFMNHCVDWDSAEGVPIQNHDWKGDCAYSSSIQVGDPVYWRMEFDFRFKDWVLKERKRNNYHPPRSESVAESTGEIIRLKEDELGLYAVTPQELDYDLEEKDPVPHWKTQPRDKKGRFLKIKNELEHSQPADIYGQTLVDSYIHGRISYELFRELFHRA